MKQIPFFTGTGTLTPLLKDGKPVKKHWLWWKVSLFTFTNDLNDPLIFHDENGDQYQPDNHFTTDGGSTPPPLWGSGLFQLSPWAFPRAYPFHDSGFQYGGLYVKRPGELIFVFTQLSRDKMNALLCRMVRPDGGNVRDHTAIRYGLALGSRFCWDPNAQAENRLKDNIGL